MTDVATNANAKLIAEIAVEIAARLVLANRPASEFASLFASSIAVMIHSMGQTHEEREIIFELLIKAVRHGLDVEPPTEEQRHDYMERVAERMMELHAGDQLRETFRGVI